MRCALASKENALNRISVQKYLHQLRKWNLIGTTTYWLNFTFKIQTILIVGRVREHPPLVGENIPVQLVSSFTSLDSTASQQTYCHIFSFWLNPILLNWKLAVQWSFPYCECFLVELMLANCIDFDEYSIIKELTDVKHDATLAA